MDLPEKAGLTPADPLIPHTRRLVLRPLADADWPDMARIGGQVQAAHPLGKNGCSPTYLNFDLSIADF
jgi:hypothetical protein